GDLTILAVQFNGVINQNRSRFSQGKTVRLRSEPLTLHVKPKPSTWQSGAWLPAQSLTLQEQWLDGAMPTYRVGEAFTRVIELQAQGLTAAQLPPLLEGKKIDGFKLYPDKPELEILVKGEGIVGVRREKVAMVPTKAGKLWLPEIRVTWWNTATQTTQRAIIAARAIEVLPALQQQGQGIQPPPVSAKVQTTTPDAPLVAVPQQVQTKSSSFWQWVAWALAGLWLLTLGLWWRSTRQPQPRAKTQAESPKLSSVEKSLKQACKHHDAKQSLKLLLAWGALYFDDAGIQYLAQLKGKSPALNDAIADLERYLYAPTEASTWSGRMLLEAIEGLSRDKGAKNKQEAMLSPLYPKQDKA
ncbi:MAG: hypothetical protein Q9N02_10375, partial [Ghiorsea sp.]|nr:hypothetical protein [Ghiorsea sp.]